jgi:glycosyltransferase involved in cell wall biosynthesis
MRVAIATVQVPFVRGGAEILANELLRALRSAGHHAELIAIPFKWYPPERILDHMLACRLLDLTESCGTGVDRVIGLKFPAYLVPHPHKVLWLLHQHRTAYDLWDHPLCDLTPFSNGVQVRAAIHQADRQFIPQARAVFTISQNVTRRLKSYCDIGSEPLYHPPRGADQFYCAEAEDYLFYPSRLNRVKRQRLVLEALAHTKKRVRVRFAGAFENPAIEDELRTVARKLKVHRRVQWLGEVTEDEKRRLFARSMGVLYTPLDEDYGYVTLEAMLASKALITCTDSGGPLEFVQPGQTGVAAEPTPDSLAAAMDHLWSDRDQARAWGAAARAEYDRRDMRWSRVVEKLLA